MSGETIVVAGTLKNLETNGGSIASGSLVAATTGYVTATDGSSFPDAEFVLGCTFATAPVDGTVVALYARPMAVDGSANTEVPDASRPNVFIGSFVLNAVTTLQTVQLTARDVPRNATYYVHNSGSGQLLAAGWTLKVTPRSYKAAP